MDKLKDLLAKGPDPTRGLRGLVLNRYQDISHARRQLWQWGEIAEALDLPRTMGPSLGEAFRRVEKRVRAGELEPPPSNPSAPRPRPISAKSATDEQQRGGAISADAANSETGKKPARPGWTNIPLDK